MRGALRSMIAAATLLAAVGSPEVAEAQKKPGKSETGVTARDPAATKRTETLASVRSWGYQLRLIKFQDVAASPFDLVVLDHALSAGRRFVYQFAPDLIASAKRKPDGSRRIVLAYLSIGEAERYRFYWDQAWYHRDKKPAWLEAMNEQWDGNYRVRFWDPAWQAILLSGPDSYLERIRAAGFDGVYLDRADVFQEMTKANPKAEPAMVALISRLAEAARRQDPEFLIVMQNAEELLRHRPVLSAIDGIAKEDLFYGVNHDEKANPPATVDAALRDLHIARKAGRRVFVVEYLHEAPKAAIARKRAEQNGFLIHFTSRDLGDLSIEPPDRPVSQR